MSWRSSVSFLAAVLTAAWVAVVASSAAAQGTGAEPRSEVPTPPVEGKAMFEDYCAPCHGVSGKGDGPAAAALKTPPRDLTLLARDNGGTFPAARVGQVLRFGVELPAHGSSDMPTWGPALRAISGGRDTAMTVRIMALTRHLETLQAK